MSVGCEAAAAWRAADKIGPRLGLTGPTLAIILGSGLGALARELTEPRRVRFADIPGFPEPGVAGHDGALIAGSFGGREVLVLAGRLHMYEGHSAALAGFPVRVMHALGARTLFVSNASGGLRRTFRPGDLMLIADQINLAWRNPLIGPVEEGEERLPDMSAPYDLGLRALLRAAALRAGIRLEEGTYVWIPGPSYETPAEVRMLERTGGDCVGMSTVPEVIVARALGMRVAGISCVANLACGISPTKIDHAEVLAIVDQAADRFIRVMREFVRQL